VESEILNGSLLCTVGYFLSIYFRTFLLTVSELHPSHFSAGYLLRLLFTVNFVGFLKLARLAVEPVETFVGKISSLVKSGFQNRRDFFSKGLGKQRLLVFRRFGKLFFWFLLKKKVRAIILSVLWRQFWFSISESCTKPSNKAYTRRWGFCAIYKHFSGFGFFLHLKHCPRPPTRG